MPKTAKRKPVTFRIEMDEGHLAIYKVVGKTTTLLAATTDTIIDYPTVIGKSEVRMDDFQSHIHYSIPTQKSRKLRKKHKKLSLG